MRKLIVESKQSDSNGTETKFELYETLGAAPEIYIDGMQGLSVVGSVVKINCFTRGHGVPIQFTGKGGTEERDLVCRLVMGTDTFLAVVGFLKQIESDLAPQITKAVQAQS